MDYEEYLMHFGVPGMKWGVRKQRVSSNVRVARSNKSTAQQKAERKAKAKKAVKVGAVVAGSILATYGASKMIKNKSMQIQIDKGHEAADRIFKNAMSNNGMGYSNVTRPWAFEKGYRNAVYSKMDNALNKNIQKGASMNTREAAKNIVNYYKKK